jgi:hypothetical protein
MYILTAKTPAWDLLQKRSYEVPIELQFDVTSRSFHAKKAKTAVKMG